MEIEAGRVPVETEKPVVTLVESRLLHAFAVPGGVIGVNAGLFAFAEREAELRRLMGGEVEQ